MISINKQGNAIVIEFTDNDKYLFNGTIEVAPNELMIVIDESNMATFKRSNNGDTLFSQLINKIQIGGINVTKDTILDEFAKIGFTTVNWSEITGKPTTFSDWDATEGEQVIANKPDLNEYATNVELNHVKSELATKADTSSLNDYALKSEITGLATKEELANYQPIGDYATTTQLNSKQDTLVSGTNIKTVNGESILGNGDIEILSVVDTEMSDTSENAVQNKVIKQYVDTASSEFTNWKNGASIVAGQNSNSTGGKCVTIGGETENTTAIGVVIGYGCKAKKGFPVIIGKDCIASNNTLESNVLINSMSTSGSNNVLIGGNTGFMSTGDNQVIINTWRGYINTCPYNEIISINTEGVATSNRQVNLLAVGGASDSVAIGLLSDGNIALRIGKDGKAYIYNNGVEVAIQDTINKVNTEIPELISSKADSANVYTKSESDAKYLTEHQSLANYATKSEIPTATSQLTNDSGYITSIPSEYITETELTSSLSTKADSANVYTKAEIDNMIGEISARLDQINGEVI